MGNVLQLDCSLADADAEIDLGSPPFTGAVPELWLQVECAFPAAYLTDFLAQGDLTRVLEFFASDGGVAPKLKADPAGFFTTLPVPTTPFPVSFTANQKYCLKVHLVAGSPPTFEAWVNDVSLGAIDMTGLTMDDIEFLDLEGLGAVTSGFVYFDNLLAGTSEGAGDICTDGFEGDLSNFNSTLGFPPATIIADPGLIACAGGGGGIVANFSGEPVAGNSPLAVQFTDLSTGGPTAWLWDFDDGETSTEQNPLHVFRAARSYDISLTAT